MWGDAARCRQPTLDPLVDATFDGSIHVYRYDPIATPVAEGRFLATISSLSTAADTMTDFDFRVAPGLVEERVPLASLVSGASGDVVGAQLSNGTVGVRAANGTFTCTPATRTCAGVAGGGFAY